MEAPVPAEFRYRGQRLRIRRGARLMRQHRLCARRRRRFRVIPAPIIRGPWPFNVLVRQFAVTAPPRLGSPTSHISGCRSAGCIWPSSSTGPVHSERATLPGEVHPCGARGRTGRPCTKPKCDRHPSIPRHSAPRGGGHVGKVPLGPRVAGSRAGPRASRSWSDPGAIRQTKAVSSASGGGSQPQIPARWAALVRRGNARGRSKSRGR